MPPVLLPLGSNLGYLEIYELRQDRIAKADLSDPQSAREAIAEMGPIDWLRDWHFLLAELEATAVIYTLSSVLPSGRNEVQQ